MRTITRHIPILLQVAVSFSCLGNAQSRPSAVSNESLRSRKRRRLHCRACAQSKIVIKLQLKFPIKCPVVGAAHGQGETGGERQALGELERCAQSEVKNVQPIVAV